jgi:hypothetical protein
MDTMNTASKQLNLALQQNEAKQRIISHIRECLVAMEEACKIDDDKAQLSACQRHPAAFVLVDVTALAEAHKTRPNLSR